MYVVRWLTKTKRGHARELINFVKKARQERMEKGDSAIVTWRIYANVFGENDIVSAEMEFPDIESAAKHVEFIESEEQQAEIREGSWYDLTAGNTIELWKLID